MMMQVDDHIETLMKQLEEEQLARAELQRELDALHQFIRTAGHDLKTPITTLKTSLYLLQRKPELAVPSRLATMEQQLDRMTKLLDAMGLMARLDAETALVFDETDILAIVQEALWDVKHLAEAQNITIIVDVPAFIPQLELNFEECKRALVNLLDNAIRYSPENAQIHVDIFEMHGYLCADIVDQGPGLSDAEIHHLFQRFYRGDDAGNMGDIGAGMGLAIVKRIMELHGGKIRVMSRHGEGSSFRLMFPLLD